MREKDVKALVDELGLVYTSQSPGDRYGTRYQFFKERREGGSLHGQIFSGRGSGEAMTFLYGYAEGRASVMKKESA